MVNDILQGRTEMQDNTCTICGQRFRACGKLRKCPECNKEPLEAL